MLRDVSVGQGNINSVGIHWVDRPDYQGKPSNGAEEGSGLLVLILNDAPAVDCELIDDNQVGEAGHSVPSPLGALLYSKGSEETSQDHDDVGNNGHEDICPRQTSEQCKVQK